MLELDVNNKEVLCLRSGAFYLIHFGEETEDEEDLRDISKISGRYPNGFEIEDYLPIEGIPYVEAMIIPYKLATFLPEYEDQIMSHVKLQVKLKDSTTVEYRFVYNETGPTEVKEAKLEINRAGKPQFETELGSIFPIWKMRKIK